MEINDETKRETDIWLPLLKMDQATKSEPNMKVISFDFIFRRK